MTLIVTVEEVARRLGLPQPLDEPDRWLIEQALADAQADLEAYLGRPVTPVTHTERVFPPPWGPLPLREHPVIEVLSQTPEVDGGGTPTGWLVVVYVAGLDGADDPELAPLRRFVRTHAMYSAEVRALWRRLVPDAARTVTSVSVEGQGITFADTHQVASDASEKGLPGGLPTLTSCDRWRVARRRVAQSPTRVCAPWPFEDPTIWKHW